MGQLLSLYATNPGLLTIGLDEDTAVVIDREGMLEVLGSGMVTIIDGRNARSDYFEREVGEVLTSSTPTSSSSVPAAALTSTPAARSLTRGAATVRRMVGARHASPGHLPHGQRKHRPHQGRVLARERIGDRPRQASRPT